MVITLPKKITLNNNVQLVNNSKAPAPAVAAPAVVTPPPTALTTPVAATVVVEAVVAGTGRRSRRFWNFSLRLLVSLYVFFSVRPVGVGADEVASTSGDDPSVHFLRSGMLKGSARTTPMALLCRRDRPSPLLPPAALPTPSPEEEEEEEEEEEAQVGFLFSLTGLVKPVAEYRSRVDLNDLVQSAEIGLGCVCVRTRYRVLTPYKKLGSSSAVDELGSVDWVVFFRSGSGST